MLERGVEWLKRYQAEQVKLLKNAADQDRPWKEQADNLDAFVYMVLADAKVAERRHAASSSTATATTWPSTAKAMYGLALHKQGHKDKLDMILQNITQYVVKDNENQTAYLKLPEDNYWWYWYGSDIEAMAYYLKLLSQDRSQGRDRAAAGQVPDQQPQARQLLEQHARHGHLRSRPWPTTSRPAARTSRT